MLCFVNERLLTGKRGVVSLERGQSAHAPYGLLSMHVYFVGLLLLFDEMRLLYEFQSKSSHEKLRDF